MTSQLGLQAPERFKDVLANLTLEKLEPDYGACVHRTEPSVDTLNI